MKIKCCIRIRMYLYICTFIVSWVLIYALKRDVNRLNPRIYNNLDDTVWTNLYIALNIAMIHGVWFYSEYVSSSHPYDFVYGFPFFLLILYVLLAWNVSSYRSKPSAEVPVLSRKIQSVMFTLFALYFILYFLFLLYPQNEYMIKKWNEIGSILLSVLPHPEKASTQTTR